MQVKDERAWAEQLTELEIDPMSRKFRDFLVFWGDTADRLMSEIEPGKLGGWQKYSANEAASKALEIAEQTFGFLSVEWIAQMLVVLVTHWVHGDKMYEDLTFIEKRLVEQATAMKLAELQEAATIFKGE